MSENKDYTKLSLEELLAEEKKIKKMEITSSVIIGALVGVLIYGVAKKGLGFLHIFLPLIIIFGINKNTQKIKQNLKQIQAEIEDKRKK